MKSFFADIFYLFGFLAIIYEASIISHSKKWLAFMAQFRKKEKEKLKKTETDNIYMALHFLYFTWVFFGIVMSEENYQLFILITGFSVLSGLTRLKHFRLGLIIDATICASLVLFIMINHFRLHKVIELW